MKKNNNTGTLIFIGICFVIMVLDIAVKLYNG